MSAAQTLKGLLSEGVTNTSDATLKSNSRIEIKEADWEGRIWWRFWIGATDKNLIYNI